MPCGIASSPKRGSFLASFGFSLMKLSLRESWTRSGLRGSEQTLLPVVLGRSGLRRFQAQMFVGQPRCAAAPGRPGQKAHLHQIRLTQVLQRHGFFAQSRRQRLQQ